ncbi:MAG: nucleotidyl transferase AbiEii/AbiGii toxin family protein [Myxococcota bacterium]
MLRAPPGAQARQRLLEGVLLRLALAPDADAFVLRGGMLVRHWFPEARRTARDVDLVCRLPYDPADLRRRLAALLADPRPQDGVRYDVDRLRLDRLWPDSDAPGLRLFAAGLGDGVPGDLTVDLTFGIDLWPGPVQAELALPRGRAIVWTCRPEVLIGRKLRVSADLSRRRWRPKDLADLWWLARVAPARAAVGEALERVDPDGRTGALLDRGWWADPVAVGKWHRFRGRRPAALPADLHQVVDDVHALLSTVTRSR